MGYLPVSYSQNAVIRLAKLLAIVVLFAMLASCNSSVDSAIDISRESVSITTEVPSDSGQPEPVYVGDDGSAEDANQEGADEENGKAGEGHDDVPDSDKASDSGEGTDGDGAVQVANSDYLGSYTLTDEAFGTQVTVTVDGPTRTIESNTLPNHETGDFPNSGTPNAISEQDRTWILTTDPTFTGQVTMAREPGVALSGVKFEPGTAEMVLCSSGESYRIEGLQELFDLGMDFNNAHVQPTGEYHYHGVSDLLVDAFTSDKDLVLVGFAADGHLMYYSKSNAYASSYSLSTSERSGSGCSYRTDGVDIDGTSSDGTYVSDWEYIDGRGDLDECNGVIIGDEYAYVITEQYPYISRCLMGEFSEAGGGPAPRRASPADSAAPTGGRTAPDLTDAAAALGMTGRELHELLGGPPPDLAAAAMVLEMTEDELLALLSSFGVGPPAA